MHIKWNWYKHYEYCELSRIFLKAQLKNILFIKCEFNLLTEQYTQKAGVRISFLKGRIFQHLIYVLGTVFLAPSLPRLRPPRSPPRDPKTPLNPLWVAEAASFQWGSLQKNTVDAAPATRGRFRCSFGSLGGDRGGRGGRSGRGSWFQYGLKDNI